MFIATLRFADKTKAPPLMDRHNAWLRRGFDDGIFVLAGSLHPGAGGAFIVHNESRAELDARMREDPFVAEGAVELDIQEITPSRTDTRLGFLED